MTNQPMHSWDIYRAQDAFFVGACQGCGHRRVIHVFHFSADNRLSLCLCQGCFDRSLLSRILKDWQLLPIRQGFRDATRIVIHQTPELLADPEPESDADDAFNPDYWLTPSARAALEQL